MSHFMLSHIARLLKPATRLSNTHKVVIQSLCKPAHLHWHLLYVDVNVQYDERDLCKSQVTYLGASVNMNKRLQSWRTEERPTTHHDVYFWRSNGVEIFFLVNNACSFETESNLKLFHDKNIRRPFDNLLFTSA